jgi:hypothetical protein
MLAANLDCHSASGLRSYRFPYEIGKRPRSLFLSRFNVRQDHSFFIGNELIVANVKKNIASRVLSATSNPWIRPPEP